MGKSEKIKVINFGHSLNSIVMKQIDDIWGGGNWELINCPISINLRFDVSTQIWRMINSVEGHFKKGEQPFIILPGLSIASVVIVSIIQGRFGLLPKLIEIKKDLVMGQYTLSKITDLEDVARGVHAG